MRTKIVYTVVGGENDIYVPQAMVAIYSARKYNPDADIILVADQDTSLIIEKLLPNIKTYLTDVVVVNVPTEFSKMLRSRYLKTILREVITGDFLYIDTDTVVTDSLEDIDNIKADVAAALDRHTQLNEHGYLNKVKADLKTVGLTEVDVHNKYFNGGVMFVRDTPIAHRLYKKWHDNWEEARKVSTGIDQPSLALANMQCGYPIDELDGIWNCQLSDNFINYLHEAKILHYFASVNRSPYKLYNDAVFDDIWTNGVVPSYLIKELETPKSFFVEKHILAYGIDTKFLRSNVHSIYVYHKWLFKIIEYLCKIIVTKRLW